jgi:hypothetical protein
MKTINITILSAFMLIFFSCEKNETPETEVLTFEVKPEHTQAPSYVDVIYHVLGVNQLDIQHYGALNSINGDSISQINISGTVPPDTIRLFYEESGEYTVKFKAQGDKTIELSESFSLTPSNKELLVDKKWQLSSFIATKPDGTTNDIYSYLFDFNKDDFYVFAANGDYTRNEGASRENPSDPDVVAQGSWSFVNSIRFDSLEYTATDKLGEYTTLWQNLEVSENAFTCQRIDGEPGNQTVNDIEFKLLAE